MSANDGDLVDRMANKHSVSPDIAILPRLSRTLGMTFYDQRVSVGHDPLDGLALFQFQGFGKRRGADEVILAVLAASLNHLQFGEVSHGIN